MSNKDLVAAMADHVRAQAERVGLTPAEWADAFNALTPEQIKAVVKKPEVGKAPACECPTRKALEELLAVPMGKDPCAHVVNMSVHLSRINSALAALSSPCPCAELREALAEHAEGVAIAAQGIVKLQAECDSLRAELATARKQIGDVAVTLEYRSAVIETQNERARRDESIITSLRARVETLETALEWIRSEAAHAVAGSNLLDLLRDIADRAAALKEGK